MVNGICRDLMQIQGLNVVGVGVVIEYLKSFSESYRLCLCHAVSSCHGPCARRILEATGQSHTHRLYGRIAERREAHKESEEDLGGVFRVHPFSRISDMFIGQRLAAIKPFEFFLYEHPIPPTFDTLKNAIAAATCVKTI